MIVNRSNDVIFGFEIEGEPQLPTNVCRVPSPSLRRAGSAQEPEPRKPES